jgi:hypothetical protein
MHADDFRQDRYGVVSGLRDGGYSDDMTLAAIAGNSSLQGVIFFCYRNPKFVSSMKYNLVIKGPDLLMMLRSFFYLGLLTLFISILFVFIIFFDHIFSIWDF